MKQGSICRVWKTYVGKGRKQLCKKALAVSLSVAAAVSFLPVYTVATPAAEKPYVSMRTSFKTLQVGQKNRMTLKNNTAGWKIQKISTNDESIASVSAKTAKSFQIEGNAAGRTTVKAVLKTTSRKKHTSKTVRCRVNVIAAADTAGPDTGAGTQEPAQAAEAEASTQAQLDAALLNSHLKKITVASKDAEKFVIPAGSYKDVDLVVDAPAADIENSGVFRSIEIRAVKPDTWIEKAAGNLVRITAKAARMVISPGAQVKEITLPQAEADVKLEISGKAENIRVQSKMKLSISGKPEADLSVSVEQAAADAQIVSETPLELLLQAAALLTFEKGAEGSAVSFASAGIQAVINNLTSKLIPVKRVNGTSSNVYAGQKNAQVSSDITYNTGSGSAGSGSSAGSSSGSSSGSGSSTGSGSNTGSQDKVDNGIPVPTQEEVLKATEAYVEMVIEDDKEDANVYWHLSFSMNGTPALEDRPELTLQYNPGDAEDDTFWEDLSDGLGYGVMSSLHKETIYKLTGSSFGKSYADISFRYVDKEKDEKGEIAEYPVQMWNEEVARQYTQDYRNQRDAESKGKPFSMEIPIKTIQGKYFVMAYDKAQQPKFTELMALPQWTGAANVPEIQAKDILDNIDLNTVTAAVAISASSLEAVQNGEAECHCWIQMPFPLQLPDELAGGKIQWKTENYSNWQDFSDNNISYQKSDDLSAVTSDQPVAVDMRFRYVNAAGAVSAPNGEDVESLYDSSKITIRMFNQKVKEICLDWLEENVTQDEGEGICQKFTVTGFAIDTENLCLQPSASVQIQKSEAWDGKY